MSFDGSLKRILVHNIHNTGEKTGSIGSTPSFKAGYSVRIPQNEATSF
jgi:hypothetical protein